MTSTTTQSDGNKSRGRMRKACPVCKKLRLRKHARSPYYLCSGCGWKGTKPVEVMTKYKEHSYHPMTVERQLEINYATMIRKAKKEQKVNRVRNIFTEYLNARQCLETIHFSTRDVIVPEVKGQVDQTIQWNRRILTEIIRDTALFGNELIAGFEIEVFKKTRCRCTYVARYKGENNANNL